MQSGKYLAVPGADVTPIRLKSYDFAVYLRDSYGFQVLASSPDIPNSMDGLCGLTIGAVSASSELPILTAQAAKCKSEGKGTLTVDVGTAPSVVSQITGPDSGSGISRVCGWRPRKKIS